MLNGGGVRLGGHYLEWFHVEKMMEADRTSLSGKSHLEAVQNPCRALVPCQDPGMSY